MVGHGWTLLGETQSDGGGEGVLHRRIEGTQGPVEFVGYHPFQRQTGPQEDRILLADTKRHIVGGAVPPQQMLVETRRFALERA